MICKSTIICENVKLLEAFKFSVHFALFCDKHSEMLALPHTEQTFDQKQANNVSGTYNEKLGLLLED
jgi:hypothetical protein